MAGKDELEVEALQRRSDAQLSQSKQSQLYQLVLTI